MSMVYYAGSDCHFRRGRWSKHSHRRSSVRIKTGVINLAIYLTGFLVRRMFVHAMSNVLKIMLVCTQGLWDCLTLGRPCFGCLVVPCLMDCHQFVLCRLDAFSMTGKAKELSLSTYVRVDIPRFDAERHHLPGDLFSVTKPLRTFFRLAFHSLFLLLLETHNFPLPLNVFLVLRNRIRLRLRGFLCFVVRNRPEVHAPRRGLQRFGEDALSRGVRKRLLQHGVLEILSDIPQAALIRPPSTSGEICLVMRIHTARPEAALAY